MSQSFLFPFTLLFINTTARVQRKEKTRNSSFFSPFPWKQKSPFYRAPKLLTVSPARSGFGTLPKHHPFHALFKLSNTSNPPPSTAYRKTIYSSSTTVSGMANPPEGYSDDFLEQILSMPSYAGSDGNLAGTAMGLQLGSGEAGSGFPSAVYPPLGLSLEQGSGSFAKSEEASGSGKRFREESGGKASVKMERDAVHLSSLFPPFGHVQPHSVRPTAPPPQPFHGQSTQGTVTVAPHPPAIRPRVRARRGQATDPHSIAERLRRERIAERMKALQELVPSSNKSDRAAMLDEIVDYVKFLRLQVKVLSMSRLGGAGAVAQLVADIPLPSVEGDASESGSSQQAWDKLSTDGTERQVAKLMEEDVGAAMQFLQSKALCIMPISLAAAIYHTQPPDVPTHVKPEPNAPS